MKLYQMSMEKTPIPSTYFLHNTELESDTSGSVSDDLSWCIHVNSISEKGKLNLGFLKLNIKVHKQDLKSTAYKTLVRPQLEYASTVRSPHTATDIQKIVCTT